MRNVTLSFHKVETPWDSSHAWQTRVSRVLMGEYVHVDVLFEDGNVTSILNDETVSFAPRTLKNPDKKMLALSVTPTEYVAMHRFAVQCCQDKVRFNRSGFYRCALPLVWRRCTDTQYFCSEYAVRLLQLAGRLTDVDPGGCHPTMLYRLIAPVCAATSNPNLLQSRKWNTDSMTGRAKSMTWPKPHTNWTLLAKDFNRPRSDTYKPISAM